MMKATEARLRRIEAHLAPSTGFDAWMKALSDADLEAAIEGLKALIAGEPVSSHAEAVLLTVHPEWIDGLPTEAREVRL